jgi:predicted site-specific integrase-resolvase
MLECIFSWSPGAIFYGSLSESLSSPEAQERKPDLERQAKYYLECILAKLHSVEFDSPSDFIEDRAYAIRPEDMELLDSFTKLGKERILDRKFGRLDRFGFSQKVLT